MKVLETIESVQDLETRPFEVEFEPLFEDTTPEGQFDSESDVEYIREQMENGNEAAWFCAKVSVKHKDFEATDYLGCCSYGSFSEFCSDNSGYYVDMVNECINQINSEIREINSEIQKKWNIRKIYKGL